MYTISIQCLYCFIWESKDKYSLYKWKEGTHAKHKGCIHSLDWTSKLEYWIGLDRTENILATTQNFALISQTCILH